MNLQKLLKSWFLFISIGALLGTLSCKDDTPDDTIEFEPTPYTIVIPKNFPTQLNIPADNPMTVEGVELGRYLYYDSRLSGKADEGMPMTCATCHLQQYAFENGTGKGIGTTGAETHHVMLPHINLAWNPGVYGWNGGTPSIEDDVKAVIYDPAEFASTNEKVLAAIKSVPMYPPLFKAAFGTEEITIDRIAKAIAQFIRTQISSNSKFDKVLRNEASFSTSEGNGYVLFATEEGADCFHCHGELGNPLMTTHGFYNNAKDSVFDTSHDRFSVSGKSSDIGAYKVTTLRNIELTGPYMHDGRFQTLDEVINFYSEGLVYSQYAHPLMHKLGPPWEVGALLNPQEKADLKAFLLTLTDTVFINDPKLSNPFTTK